VHVESKQQFHLNQEVINRYIAQIVIEISIKERILAKNNQKKEKAERNKIYANKYRKRSSSKFGNRRSNNDSK